MDKTPTETAYQIWESITDHSLTGQPYQIFQGLTK